MPSFPSVQAALIQIPSADTWRRVAVNAIMLSMHEATVAASISAGVGYSPRPPSALGISVVKVAADGQKLVWQRISPECRVDEVYFLSMTPIMRKLGSAVQSILLPVTFMTEMV